MRALSAAELLAVWELASNQPPGQRVLALLAACAGDASPEDLAQLSIGQSDARLLSLRERTFGSQLAASATCPGCGEALEFAVNVADIRSSSPAHTDAPFEIERDDFKVQFRLPNNIDISTLDPDADPQINRQRLLSRCVLGARRGGMEVSAGDLPVDIVRGIADRMAEADPQADVQFALSCPECRHHWAAPFDIGSFVWSELSARAVRLLNDVHMLASAYGWSEADILSMSPTRRETYLELLTQ
ncbi:MAG TPA: hypothetical protein VIW21_11000 [Chthoniobacterales bacterium]|jgi:hypothetical protein